MLAFLALLAATFFLAYANGANDNFKGVATLHGCNTAEYRRALWWATAATFAGSLLSLYFAQELIHHFSGKGLVPDAVAASPAFLLAVGLSAAATVFAATLAGFPISTTHALTGALVGAGFGAVGPQLNFSLLGTAFFLPLLVSPLLAAGFCIGLYTGFTRLRRKLGIEKTWCVCVENAEPVPVPSGAVALMRTASGPQYRLTTGTQEACEQRYQGDFFGFSLQGLLDRAHYFSAAMVSFARGLNDTPKVVALLFTVSAVAPQYALLFAAGAMAAGGLLNARKVAQTLSREITPMQAGQGFTANLVTSLLVIFASRLGMPVSTTHVSTGAIFGVATLSGQGNGKKIFEILLSWVLTLPVAALVSGIIYFLIR